MKSTRLISLLLTAVLLLALIPGRAAAAENTGLTSFVDQYQKESGTFTLSADARFFVVTDREPSGMLRSTLQLASAQFAAKGLPTATALDIAYGTQDKIRDGDIVVRADQALTGEAYRLEITQSNAVVYYTAGTAQVYYGGEGSHNSLLYGLRTLMRLFDGSTASCCTVSDAPDTAERTVQLDIGRKYWSVNWIKNLIDEMSWMGYNAMDLHMTEDQGCRANIWRDQSGAQVLDANGNDFSWMIGYNLVSWNDPNGDPKGAPDPNADKFYNRDELTEIVNYAKSRHIEIIPAVDYPTHADCIIAKYKSNFVDTGTDFTFRYDGATYTGHSSLQGGNNATINIGDDYARTLSFAVTDAYAKFFGDFGCTKFNIGGDEVTGGSYTWASSAFNTSNGGSTSNYKDAYVIYMNKLAELLQRSVYGSDNHSYSVRAWNDCLFGNGYYCYYPDGKRYKDNKSATVAVNSGIDVLFWTAESEHVSPNTLADQGRKVYNCLNWYTYYVLRNSKNGGDARSDSNKTWPFNHGRAEFVYSGCNYGCVYGSNCRHVGGWTPTSFNGCLSNCFTDQYRSDAQLGGAYFLIWGDWAGWDNEEHIWTRDGSYNLIGRMWANAAKQWNWDVDASLNYTAFKTMTDTMGDFPGFNGCTNASTLPASGRLVSDAPFVVYVKTKIGSEEKTLETIGIDAEIGESFTVRVAVRNGYCYSHTDGADFTPSLFGENGGTVTGTVGATNRSVTVWYENAPYLDGLKLLLDNPTPDNGYANYADYAKALGEAESFYANVSASARTLTDQETVDRKMLDLLLAKIALARTAKETTLQCALDTRYVLAGHVAVLCAETSGDATDIHLTLNGQSVTRWSVASRQNADGTKSWRVQFPAPDTTGIYTYQVTASTLNGDKTVPVEITVR